MTQTDLSSRAILATLHTSVWTGFRRDKQITAEICQEKNAARKAIRANKSLVGDEIKPVRSAERQLRECFRRHTLAWTDDSTRILKASKFSEFRTIIAEPLTNFKKESDKFIELYPEVVENAKNHLGSAWNEDDYPSQSKLRRQFGVSLSFAPLPNSQSNDFRMTMTSEEIAIITANVEQTLQETMIKANKEILDRLRTPLIHYAERLKIYQKNENGVENSFRDTLVENIRAVVDLAPQLNITDNPVINELCQTIKREIAIHEPEALRQDEALRHESSRRAEELIDEISSLGF